MRFDLLTNKDLKNKRKPRVVLVKKKACNVWYGPKPKQIGPGNMKIEPMHSDEVKKEISDRGMKYVTKAKACNAIQTDILRDYDLIINSINGIKLQSYQKKAVDKFVESERGIIAMFGTGTGKTITSIAAVLRQLSVLKETNPNKFEKMKVIVITPNAVIEQFRQNLNTIKSIDGVELTTEMKRKFIFSHYVDGKHWKMGSPVVFGKNFVFSDAIFVLDEAHMLRNAMYEDGDDVKQKQKKSTKGKKALEKSLATKIYKCAKKSFKVMILTATPMYNSVDDFYSLHDLVRSKDDKLEGKSIEKKREIIKKTVVYYTSSGKDKYPEDKEHVKTLLLHPIQKALLNKLKKEKKSNSKDAFYSKSRQINDWPKEEYKKWPPVAFPPKLVAVAKQIEKLGQGFKHVIYSEYVGEASGWTDFIKKYMMYRLPESTKAKVSVSFIAGKMSNDEKTKSVTAFNEKQAKDEIKILILSPSGGTGLDLKGVRTLHILEPLWSPAYMLQVKGRAVRYESHKDYSYNVVDIYRYLMKDSTDEEVNKKMERKYKEIKEFEQKVLKAIKTK